MDTNHYPRSGVLGKCRPNRCSIVLAVIVGAIIFLAFPGSSCAKSCFSSSLSCGSLSNSGLSAFTGYFGSIKATQIAFSAHTQNPNSLLAIRHKFSLQGINLELMAPFRVYGPYGMAFGLGYSVCFNEPGEENLQFSGSPSIKRTWLAEPQVFNLQAALTMDLSPSLLGILGFKYENFLTNFVNAESITPGYGGGLNNIDFTFNAYIPYIGLIYGNALNNTGSNFSIGATAFPILLGSVTYRETVGGGINIGASSNVQGFQGSDTVLSGYYINAFADMSTMINSVQLAAYAKCDILNAVSNGFITGGGDGRIPDVVFNFGFQRSYWGIGFRASIGF